MNFSWFMVEKSFNLLETCHFNPGLFNPIVQKFMVQKSGVENFIVEKSGVERFGVEAWTLPTAEILSGKNALAFLVCGFLMKSFKKMS